MDIRARVRNWAKRLPYWEQVILNHALAGKPITIDDERRFERILLSELQLEPSGSIATPPSVHSAQDGPPPGAAPRSRVTLVSFHDLCDAGTLVERQTLAIGPALTVIYGRNGSGKSTYARMLACATNCFGHTPVQSDVTLSQEPGTAPTGTLVYAEASGHRCAVNCTVRAARDWEDNGLRGFRFFDERQALEFVRTPQPHEYVPAALRAMEVLADISNRLRTRVKSRVARLARHRDFAKQFVGHSPVRDAVAHIDGETDIPDLRLLAVYGEKEQQRSGEIEQELSELRSLDKEAEIADLRETITDLERLHQQLRALETLFCDDAVHVIHLCTEACRRCRSEARCVSTGIFDSDDLGPAGDEHWQRFVRAAKQLTDQSQGSGNYPKEGRECLLCHQPLSEQASDLIRSLWAYVDGTVQARLKQAENRLSRHRTRLTQADVGFFGTDSVCRRFLSVAAPELARSIADFVQACSERRVRLLGALGNGVSTELPPLPDSGITKIDELVAQCSQAIIEMERQNPTAEITRLQREQMILQHRQILSTLLPDIETYITDLRLASRAKSILKTSGHITTMQRKLYEESANPEYVAMFQRQIDRLGRPIRATVAPQGKKGHVVKRLRIDIAKRAIRDEPAPRDILSTGEQRSVALADLLTEVALDPDSQAIILDDPDSGLDLSWSKQLAQVLVDEATRRQVIVCTHNPLFANYLQRGADHAVLSCQTHWLKLDASGRPGVVHSDVLPSDRRVPQPIG